MVLRLDGSESFEYAISEVKRYLREDDQLAMDLLMVSKDASRTDEERARALKSFQRIEQLELDSTSAAYLR